MAVNALPKYDTSINTTGCCPKFNPDGWELQELHFEEKRFVRAKTLSFFFVPLNIGKVFARVMANIDKAGARDEEAFIVLSRDPSPFWGEHLFAVSKDVPGEQMTTLSGDLVTRVFEGPFQKVRDWCQEMTELARSRGRSAKNVWFFYTTCPKCAKVYGKNYVVGAVELG